MKIFRNKLFMGLMCIVLGLMVVFLAAPAVTSEQTKTAEVVTAVENIEAGTVISVEMIKTTRIPSSIVSSDAVKQQTTIGKYATSTIWAGDIITAPKITDFYAKDDNYALATAKGKMVVSVTVRNLSVMAAARIKEGDVVTVMALLDGINGTNANVDNTGIVTSSATGTNDQPSDTSVDTAAVPTPTPIKDVRDIEPTVIIYPEIKYMEIAAVVASGGENAKIDPVLTNEQKNTVPVTISFYATEDQARRLAELEMNGTIYIAFVARGEEAYAFIPLSEKVLLPNVG